MLLTFVDSLSSACNIALNLLMATILLPALRLRAGALRSAISRMGPSLCVESVAGALLFALALELSGADEEEELVLPP